MTQARTGSPAGSAVCFMGNDSARCKAATQRPWCALKVRAWPQIRSGAYAAQGSLARPYSFTGMVKQNIAPLAG